MIPAILLSLAIQSYQAGPRVAYLVENMQSSALKGKLQSCLDKPIGKQDFSIGHRGAPLFFPEHSSSSHRAAALMGAGTLECDVNTTKDSQMVCRHDICDLHRTTDILLRSELAKKCSQTFKSGSASCCTSDITLKEYKSLCVRQDKVNPLATTVEDYLRPSNWAYTSCEPPLSLEESIDLFKELNVKMTPELKVTKTMNKDEIHAGAQKLVDTYKAKKVPASSIYLQSFELEAIRYWLEKEPEYAKNVVFLDGRYEQESFNPDHPKTWKPTMAELKDLGIGFLAPPVWMLLRLDEKNEIVASKYALEAKKHGLKFITWSLERSSIQGWYYQGLEKKLSHEGDIFFVIEALDQKVGVEAIFSDWPETVSFYASCLKT